MSRTIEIETDMTVVGYKSEIIRTYELTSPLNMPSDGKKYPTC